MFWIAQALTLIAGLIGIALVRAAITRRFPRTKEGHLDLVLILLLVAGVALAIHEYRAQTVETQVLSNQIEVVRNYSHVAGLTFNGMAYVGGDVTLPTDISPSVEGTWREVGGNRFRPVCEPDALEKDRRAIQKFPKFPFTYYALAYCLQKQGSPEWRAYAEQAAMILQQTTSISGHQEIHDQTLAYLRKLLSGVE